MYFFDVKEPLNVVNILGINLLGKIKLADTDIFNIPCVMAMKEVT